MQDIAKWIIVFGLAVTVFGLITYFLTGLPGASRALDWFSYLGKLPGDIRIEKPGFRFYFPITTMILLSAILTLLIHLFRKF